MVYEFKVKHAEMVMCDGVSAAVRCNLYARDRAILLRAVKAVGWSETVKNGRPYVTLEMLKGCPAALVAYVRLYPCDNGVRIVPELALVPNLSLIRLEVVGQPPLVMSHLPCSSPTDVIGLTSPSALNTVVTFCKSIVECILPVWCEHCMSLDSSDIADVKRRNALLDVK